MLAGLESPLYTAWAAMTSPALRTLLSGLIDYAGLFPPAGLGMAEAVRNYDTYVRGERAWMLGRFIVPAARLAEYEDAVRNAGLDANAWSLSVLATANDADIIARFNTGGDESGASGLGSIDTLEIKVASAREIQDAAQAFGGNYRLYFETPPEKWHALLQATAVARARAKIRTGGEAEARDSPGIAGAGVSAHCERAAAGLQGDSRSAPSAARNAASYLQAGQPTGSDAWVSECVLRSRAAVA